MKNELQFFTTRGKRLTVAILDGIGKLNLKFSLVKGNGLRSPRPGTALTRLTKDPYGNLRTNTSCASQFVSTVNVKRLRVNVNVFDVWIDVF